MRYFILIFISFILACNLNNSSEQHQSPRSDNSINSSNQIVLLDTSNNAIGDIQISSYLNITMGSEDFTSKMKKGKRKYYDDNGICVAKVSYKPDGFKIKREDGSLFWKVKFKPNKVKIADNEEMLNPYSLKYEGGKGKLKYNEITIGKVRVNDQNIKITSNGNILYIYNKRNIEFGIAGFNDIPLLHRLIILAEMGKR